MKDIGQIATVRNLRSMRSVGARSVPKAQRSPYLDLYVLKREKDRLTKEMAILEKRKKIVGRLLNDVNRLISGLQVEVQGDREIKTVRHTRSNPLRTMPIKY